MRRFLLIQMLLISGACGLTAATTASAQPSLASLWPNADGLRWEYGFRYTMAYPEHVEYASPAFLQLAGTVETPGGTAQVLRGDHGGLPVAVAPAPALPFPAGTVWRGRPDLREAIVSAYGQGKGDDRWYLDFLHTGYFMKRVMDIEMWQADFNHRTWLYLEDDLTVGASFTLQLLPEIVDDLFLHGTVASVDATVATDAGTFTGAVRMEYLLDLGRQDVVDEGDGTLLGTVHGEIRGHVHYVPDVGPVDMYEEALPYAELDCPGCPQYMHDLEGLVVETMLLYLTSLPTSSQAASWGELKATYR